MVLPKGKQTKIAPQFSTLPCKSLCQAIDVVNSIRTGDAVRCLAEPFFSIVAKKNQFAMAIFHIDTEIFSIKGQNYSFKIKVFSIRKITLGDIIGNIYAIVKKEGSGAQCVMCQFLFLLPKHLRFKTSFFDET